jgi:ComEC/Rec2-related protein
MRRFLLAGLAAWLAGLVTHQLTGDIRFLFAAAGLVVVALIWRKANLPLIVAAACLVALGYVKSAPLKPMQAASCPQTVAPEALVTVQHFIRGPLDEQRFIARISPGCGVVIKVLPFPAFGVGDSVQVKGVMVPTSRLARTAPGYADYLTSQGVIGVMDFPQVSLAARDTSWARSLTNSVRSHIQTSLREPEASLVRAMLLAEDSTLPPDIIARFQHTGVSHILAISGSNISLLAVIIVALVWLLPLPGIVQACIVAILMWMYVIIIGMPTSAVRAVIFWTLALFAYQGRRLTSLPSIIILACVAMVTASPAVISDVGFQLSVAAVAGIGLILFLVPRWPATPIWRALTQSMAITAGATVATWPIVAFHFQNLSTCGLLVNAIVVPLTGIFVVVSLAALACSYVVPLAALLISFIVHIIWRLMDTATRAGSAIPFGYFENVRWPLWLMAGYYALLVAGSIWWLKRQGRSWREIWA